MKTSFMRSRICFSRRGAIAGGALAGPGSERGNGSRSEPRPQGSGRAPQRTSFASGTRLALIASILVTGAAAQQIAIQPVPSKAPSRLSPIIRRRSGLASASQDAQDSLSSPAIDAPISGYVASKDHPGVRPIVGFRGFSFLGDPLDFGDDLAFIVSSPNQNYVAAVNTAGSLSLWVDVPGGLAQAALPADVSLTSRAISSPLGFSLAVVSDARGLLQVFSSLPNNPTLALSASFSDLGGAPRSVAVSDDGARVIFTIRSKPDAGGREDSLYTFQSQGQPQLIWSARRIGSVAFAPNLQDAVAADEAANQVRLFRNANGFFAPSLLADENAGISRPVAAEFSRDGQQIVVANARSKTVQTFSLNGVAISSTDCADEPILLGRMIGNAVFRLTNFDGSSLAIFDGDSDPAAVFRIRASTQDQPTGVDELAPARK